MTLLEVEELTQYWVDHPPLHLMIAAYLGVGDRSAKRASIPQKRDSFDIGAALVELGPSFLKGNVHAGLGPVVLDFAELRRRVCRPPEK
jgi:hypothetical protein